MPATPNPTVVLASSSPFRRILLQRLGIAFETVSPDVDESAHPGESAEALVLRLAETKARAVSERYPNALLIGSDQVAVIGEHIVSKPGDHDTAVEQLLASSGRSVRFLTAVCLLNAATGNTRIDMIPTTVRVRVLDRDTIENYLRRERPYGCAGSLQIEGLGIALTECVESEDPTALIGLPLITLIGMLRAEGVDVIKANRAGDPLPGVEA
jgi:septum formation protein